MLASHSLSFHQPACLRLGLHGDCGTLSDRKYALLSLVLGGSEQMTKFVLNVFEFLVNLSYHKHDNSADGPCV